jgi:replicative DNA helicase
MFEVRSAARPSFLHIGGSSTHYETDQLSPGAPRRGRQRADQLRDLDEIAEQVAAVGPVFWPRGRAWQTSMALACPCNVATLHQATVGVFSLEMSREQAAASAGGDTGINTHTLRRPYPRH